MVTNEHVVEGQSRVSVTVNDSTTYSGTVLGVDAVRDLAVVSICCGDFMALEFGDAAGLEAGDEVVNIGYALGIEGSATVTKGIVSALRWDSNHRAYVIQSDAVINPGNSGGPMLSAVGQILGINTFKYEETASGRPTEGLGFAISAVTVQQRIPALRAGTAMPTATPLSPTPMPNTTGQYDFGPTNGSIQHDPSMDFIKGAYTGVSFADAVVEATLVNPYAASSNLWSHGFFLRYQNGSPYLLFAVSSDRRWEVKSHIDGSYQNLAGGTVANLNTDAGGKNQLMVVAIGERGWFFVNGDHVASVDLSSVTSSGDIATITGVYIGHEVAGAMTRYEGFKGYELKKRYGPAAGGLEKEPGRIGTHGSGVRARDFVTEAGFSNPQGKDWSYGFIVRNPEFNRLEVIGVTDNDWWFHKTRNVGDDAYTEVASGYLTSAGASLSSSQNRLLLIAVEESGWFFVNDRLLAKLDIGHNQDVGGVSVVGDFFTNHQGNPQFKDFNVWAP